MANERQQRRLEFHSILEALPGVREAYYQRPPKTGMVYPCILYSDRPRYNYANNQKYLIGTIYTITFITRDPDSDTRDYILAMPYTSFDREYTSEDLHHYVYTSHYK